MSMRISMCSSTAARSRFRPESGSTSMTQAYTSEPSCAQPCISPLHTHDVYGILHTEAKKNQFNDLGEFFTEWNVRLDNKCVGGYCKPVAPISIYVDGNAYTGNPRQIELEDLREIAIVIGTPPAEIP